MIEGQRFKDNLETRQKIIEVLKFYLSLPTEGKGENCFCLGVITAAPSLTCAQVSLLRPGSDVELYMCGT